MDPDPDPNLDLTLFLSDFKDAKKYIFSYFFLKICLKAHYIKSKKCNFVLKFLAKILFCRHYFCPLNTFMRIGKDPDPDPYL